MLFYYAVTTTSVLSGDVVLRPAEKAEIADLRPRSRRSNQPQGSLMYTEDREVRVDWFPTKKAADDYIRDITRKE